MCKLRAILYMDNYENGMGKWCNKSACDFVLIVK